MKKREIELFLTVLILMAGSACADVLDTSSTPSYSTNQSITKLYNISIRNTNILPGINFTQIAVTFPGGFVTDASTNGTSALGTLVISGQTLTWTNATYLVLNGTTHHFWVNATSNTVGVYNITVTSTDTSSVTNTSNVPITIISSGTIDSTSPVINFTDSTPSDYSVLINPNFSVGVTVSDNVAISLVRIFLYNSNRSLIDTVAGSNSSLYKNYSLALGIYYINATANDTSGNKASTETRKINISSPRECTPKWDCTDWNECMNKSQTRTCTDSNSCGDETQKPAENQSCCIPNWDCTDWAPPECPKNRTQIRQCADFNDCNDNTNKPPENQSCDYKPGLAWLYYVIIGVVIAAIAGIGIIIALHIYKNYMNGM